MIAQTFLLVLHWLSGLIVLAIGLAQLEHLSPGAKGLTNKVRLQLLVEAAFWIVLCIGAAGAIVTPLMPLEKPTLQDACVLIGVAGIVICRRIGVTACRT